MSLHSKLLRNDALLPRISEAKPSAFMIRCTLLAM